MADDGITLSGTGAKVDTKQVLELMDKAPGRFAKVVRKWLMNEGAGFTGSRKKTGSFRRSLSRKKHKGREGTWDDSIGRMFKFYVTPRTIWKDFTSMQMTAGIMGEGKTKEGIKLLQTGGSISSPKYMPVPVWSNLTAAGITKDAPGTFKRWAAAGKLEYIIKGGRVYWFYNDKLVFRGVKRITVKKQFDFFGAWAKRKTAAVLRGQKRVEALAVQLNKRNFTGE